MAVLIVINVHPKITIQLESLIWTMETGQSAVSSALSWVRAFHTSTSPSLPRDDDAQRLGIIMDPLALVCNLTCTKFLVVASFVLSPGIPAM
ncbi:hypothetical protein BRADI_5g15045v3 [Brachypodium distachyon]|uniref:Uncharacterized protein n=1 Tax=Brachypodium distachyon TaxID=15368 RepID=A0A2K2CHC5_BRADI|nr:hypothetical protein BRADI_5g15045v3 [Brachypodium distachyon]PNT61419.1 hypothetical protein BRADI_5g15045v3 [Brachypodium distachyon]PNT61420.1 hypothetical protein BRADI_5g15045v3 [Brachypodium distachyon]